MIIRNGNYTRLNGYDCALSEAIQEAPIPFTHFVVKWDLNQSCPFEDFELNKHGDVIKIFKRRDITNAYLVMTKGIYNGDKFRLLSYNESRNVIGLITDDSELAVEHNFLKLSDRYIKEVNPKELDSIWEERSKSEYDLPMPAGLLERKIIFTSKRTEY
jgi:hypothetical protein